MKNGIVKKLTVILTLFAIGGVGYMLIELLWRRRTHILMGAAGGLCFNLIYAVSRLKRCGIMLKSALSALMISTVELIFGVVCNLGLDMRIWDYSKAPGNILGQVCPEYSLYWFLLSLPTTFFFTIFRKKKLSGTEIAEADEIDNYRAA